jgi:acyl-CoA synthetase (NDP forming)
MVGPNCLGVLSAEDDRLMNATFAPTMPLPGSVAIASQSGALGIAILDLAREANLGVSAFVSMGNKADVSSNDLLEYWEEDGQTSVVVLYLESFGNPRRFARVARRVGRSKPIVAVKGGRGEAGQRAAQSHTAALAGSYVAIEALFRQAGVTHCESLEESFDAAMLFARQPLPAGKRVGIVSNAGGLGILCADACEANGLEVLQLAAETVERLRGMLSPALHPGNPLDVGASSSAEAYRRALELVRDDPHVDAVIALFVPLATNSLEDAAAALLAAGDPQGRKPILASFAGRHWPEDLPQPPDGVPVYRFPEAAARALGHAASRAEWLRRPAGDVPAFEDVDTETARRVVETALQREQSVWMQPEEVDALLGAYRLRRPRSAFAHSPEAAADAFRAIGGPVALKLISRTVLHKTDVGGVHLDIQSAEAAAKAYEAIDLALQEHGFADAFEGVLVQEMVSGGIECLIGVVNDPLFGPLIAFGLGGTTAEVIGDVAFRLHPLTDADADELITSVKAARLLAGYRGAPAADLPALRELMLRVSKLVEDIPELAELDLNPVIALPSGEGALALDARIRLERPA